mgnify:CR=1 FL=1
MARILLHKFQERSETRYSPQGYMRTNSLFAIRLI